MSKPRCTCQGGGWHNHGAQTPPAPPPPAAEDDAATRIAESRASIAAALRERDELRAKVARVEALLQQWRTVGATPWELARALDGDR